MTSRDGTIDWDAATGQPDRVTDPPPDSATALVQLLDRYLADLQAGRAPDRARLLADHPELADRLESCLAGIDFIHRTTAPGDGGEQPARLGEFAILREIGRGGMGVVYEAEQTTLRRRVALKVLRFGVVADEGAMERFRREAETVARLHHTNIVPIFAVGSEQGVQYFAMQFIEGHNLADVLAEAVAHSAPVPADDVAEWGLQAAEALEYAHRRGVIHRDVKPSNLLLDPEGVVWLTDFGLAKRADEATLTIAGTLMGTPRYMSPEQAEAMRRPVDHRTDIYSLGATLYELATGRPVFEAATPHGVIHRILADEPAPPRQIRPGLPRDLETLILTCLAKDPARRYPTAQALADDLRAVLDGRPIQARRVGPVGRAVRWVKRQRRTVGVAAVAAATSVLLAAGSSLAWTLYSRAQLARLVLTTAEPHLTAEIRGADEGEPIVPGVSLPTHQPLQLPAGDHRVRVSAPGQPTETYGLLLRRGESRNFEVGLGTRHLWEPIAASSSESLEVVDLDGRADLVQRTSLSIRRIDGTTGQTLWVYSPQAVLEDHDPREDELIWEEASDAFDRKMKAIMSIDSSVNLPGPVRPAPDLDGDGVGDLVWAGRHAPLLWAFSGRGDDQGRGRVLWLFRAEGGGSVVGLPDVLDVDADGTSDLIATFRDDARWWVEAISGRSGTSLWRFDGPGPLAQVPAGNAGRDDVNPARIGQIGGRPLVVLAMGTAFITLDAANGEPDWESDLGAHAIREPILADLDGDGQLDVLLLVEGPPGQSLAALSPTGSRTLWTRPIQATWWADDMLGPGWDPDWPLVVDLDGDGASEVVVPASGTAGSASWAGVEALRGADGQRIWRRLLRTPVYPAQVERFVAGPDLDSDGHRELFVASIAGERSRSFRPEDALYVDALSGRDGRGLWWWRRAAGHNDKVGPLLWWGAGSDGWPQLLVTHASWPDRPRAICMLSAGTGALEQELPDAFDPRVAEFDGDGIPDLGYRTSESPSIRMGSGRFHALRGRPPAAWGRLGLFQPVADLDGDGIEDLIDAREEGMSAFSGRDGRIVWDAPRPSRAEKLHGRWDLIPGPASEAGGPETHADLDGDGTPDLLVGLAVGGGYGSLDDLKTVPIPLQAVCGRTGRRLWGAEEVPNPAGGQSIFVRTRSARCADLDGDGTPEVVAVVHLHGPLSPGFDQLWLMVFSGRDGRIRWRRPLADRVMGDASPSLERFGPAPWIADLDGNEDRDIALAVPLPSEAGPLHVEIRAFGGRDGRPLWAHRLPPRATRFGGTETLLPELALGDLDGDGVPDLVAVDPVPIDADGEIAPPFGPRDYQAIVLDGRSGRPLGEPWQFRDARSPTDGPPRPVLADLEGRGRHVIVLGTRDEAASRITLLDARGQVLQQRAFEAVDLTPWPRPVFAGDLTGDGADEIAYVGPCDDSTVLVFKGDLGRPLWSRTPGGEARIIGLAAGGPGRPTCVVVGGRHNTVVGLDGVTGRTLWHGQGRRGDSGFSSNGAPLFEAPLLHDATPGGLPRVVSRSNSTTLCVSTLPADPTDDRFAPDRAPAVVLPVAADPRLARPLPWTVMTRDALVAMLESALVALVLLALPALAVARVVRRRPLRVARLLVVPVILGVTIVAARTWKSDVPPPYLIMQAAAGLPLVVLLYQSGLWLVRRRWWRLALLAIAVTAVAVVLAAVLIRVDARQLPPWQRYSWDQWYWIAAPASYGAGLVLTLGLVLAALARIARRGWGRMTRKFRPA